MKLIQLLSPRREDVAVNFKLFKLEADRQQILIYLGINNWNNYEYHYSLFNHIINLKRWDVIIS